MIKFTKVCIIGAGPSGLLLALLLTKRGGFDIVIVERGPDHETVAPFDPTRSYTIDVTGKGLLALEAAGVMSEMRADLLAFRGIRILFRKDELFEGDCERERMSGDGSTFHF